MNKTLAIFLFLLALLVACRPPTADRRPLKFTAYENNPILGPGGPGEWDELGIDTPDIIAYDNMYYLFYTGSKNPGRMSVGLAISNDGYHFKKYENNPVLTPGKEGFDAFSVAATRVVKADSVWVMYFNALEIAGFSPGPSIGRAEAANITGPWTKSAMPALTAGKRGEWDDGFVIPCTVLALEDGSYIMYYSGGKEFYTQRDFYIGMATSTDGTNWKKYNDPATKEHPFADSDPVLSNGKHNEWDNAYVWMADIKMKSGNFSMYYTGIQNINHDSICSIGCGIGYATSKDGIHWEKYKGNPVYTVQDDPYVKSGELSGCLDNPSIVFLGDRCLMFYDYSTEETKIGMATAHIPSSSPSDN